MSKIFIEAQIKDLLNQVHTEKITFSRLVEILNEYASGRRIFNIQKLDESLSWVEWLEESKSNGLNEISQSEAIRDIYKKVNEIIQAISNPIQ